MTHDRAGVWQFLTPLVLLGVIVAAMLLLAGCGGSSSGSSDTGGNSGSYTPPAPTAQDAKEEARFANCLNAEGTYATGDLVNENTVTTPLGYNKTYYFAEGPTATYIVEDGKEPRWETSCS